jgi:hypothetical protein
MHLRVNVAIARAGPLAPSKSCTQRAEHAARHAAGEQTCVGNVSTRDEQVNSDEMGKDTSAPNLKDSSNLKNTESRSSQMRQKQIMSLQKTFFLQSIFIDQAALNGTRPNSPSGVKPARHSRRLRQ